MIMYSDNAGTMFNKAHPVASFNSPMGQVENAFIQSLGFSVAEAMQRLVTDEVLHEVEARHIHRLLAEKKPDCTRRCVETGAIWRVVLEAGRY